MKKILQNWFAITIGLMLNFGLNAQNIVNTTPSNDTINCNGTAVIGIYVQEHIC
ncbi:MAG: hypothetical protein HYR91_06860 [Flavobacteriia bacterium]|nr:hypothetical protein [Flavobacteriia bacterium]